MNLRKASKVNSAGIERFERDRHIGAAHLFRALVLGSLFNTAVKS